MIELLPNIIATEGRASADNFRIGKTEIAQYGWELPPGTYRILCTYPDCTEQEAAEVVEYLDLYKCRKTHPLPNREGFTKT